MPPRGPTCPRVDSGVGAWATLDARRSARPVTALADLSLPLFLVGAARRSWRELAVTLPDLRPALAFCASWALAGASPRRAVPWRMALARQACGGANFASRLLANHCAHARRSPASETWIRVVRDRRHAWNTCRAIHGAQFRLFERTGHLGTVSAPDRFASIVSTFLKSFPTEHA